jgi:twitching motility protein PilT
MSLDEWVLMARELGASDLHLETEAPPVARVRGELRVLRDAVSATRLTGAAKAQLGDEGWSQFLLRGSADLSADIAATRCRISIYRTVRGLAVAVRLLQASASDLAACNLHPDLRNFIEARTGLVIVSGPTGSGKSTTLAALVEEINSWRAWNVISLESPIEYLFTNRRSFIRQREIPTHSPSYEQAIIDALRENPDALVIGEMRSPEVMRLTLNAAETGHLVLTTMHSASCGEALSRLCMSFAAEIQSSIRAQLADCLVGVVCQRLDPLDDAHMLLPRCEILTASTAAKGTIRAGHFSQIATVLQSGGDDGMWNFDRYRRWMAHKHDWVRPGTAARPVYAALRSGAGPPPKESTGGAPAEARTGPPPIRAPFELSIDENVDLAELVRKIDDATP